VRLFPSFVLLLTTLPGAAQATGPTPAEAAVAPGRITGTVICSDTRKPCRGAEVYVTAVLGNAVADGTANFSTNAGIDGTYSFENLPPGKYAAFANLPGYLSSRIFPEPEPKLDPAARVVAMAAWGEALTFVIGSSQTSTHDITLFRGASLSGRVLYADGTPAISAVIRVEHADPDWTGAPDKDHHIVPSRRDDAKTNDLGQFRISGIRPGHYRVAVLPNLQNNDGWRDFTPATFAFYSGDTIHRKAAKVYELRLGDDVGNIDITVPIGGLHQVSGHLATAEGNPLNMGILTLTSVDDDTVIYRAELDRTGAFKLTNVPPDTYALTVSNAFIGKPADPTKSAEDEATALKPARAFTADSLPVIVKDSDVPDVAPMLKEIPLPPKAKDDDGQN
jgi:hypothetical protein